VNNFKNLKEKNEIVSNISICLCELVDEVIYIVGEYPLRKKDKIKIINECTDNIMKQISSNLILRKKNV